MSILSFLLGEKKSPHRSRRSACSSSSRTSASAAGRRPIPPALQKELVAVISKYVHISDDDIRVSLERRDDLEVLEVKIEIPQA